MEKRMGWNFLFPFAAAPCFCWPPEKIFGVKKHQIFVWCSLTAHAGGGRLLKTFPPKNYLLLMEKYEEMQRGGGGGGEKNCLRKRW